MITALSDEVHTARKAHGCNVCLGRIAKGDRYRRQKCAEDGRVWTWKAHALCDAIWLEAWEPWWDEGDQIEPFEVRARLVELFGAMFATPIPSHPLTR